MSAILIVHQVESSERDRSSKDERTHKLMVICSDVPRKAITEYSKFSYLNESYMLQIYFTKTARTTLWIPILNFSFDF